MRSKRGGTAVGCLLMITVLSASPLQMASAIDRSGARTLDLQRDLRSVRSQIERAPRASSFDLEDLQRRLHDRRIDAPRDPRLQEIEIEVRRLRAKADRNADRPGIAAALPRTLPLAVRAPIEKPRHLGGAHTPAAARPARPYFGQRVVARCRETSLRSRPGSRGATPRPQPGCSRRRGAISPRSDACSTAASPTIPTSLRSKLRSARSKNSWRLADAKLSLLV